MFQNTDSGQKAAMAKLSSLRNTATNLNHIKFWKLLYGIELEGEKFNDRTLLPSFLSKNTKILHT